MRAGRVGNMGEQVMTEEQDRKLMRQAAWIQEHPYLATGIICLWVPLAVAVGALWVKHLLR